jgi:peptidoglycan-associated lipoprotein
MKTPTLKICIPLALAFAAGCATQSGNDSAAGTPTGKSTSSTATSRGTNSGSMSGTPGSRSGMASGQPGERSVFFEFDKSNLTPQDRKLVEAHAQYLKEHPDLKVRVEGNTDERGSKEYNLALGQRRAESVTKVMKLLGVKDQRVEAVSYGEEKPRSQGHDEQAWQQNRRSDISY